VNGLEEVLNRQQDQMQNGQHAEFICYQGLKHAKPFIEDGVEQMVREGITEAVGIVLAPHYSTMSVGSYIKRAKEKAEEVGLKINFVESYHLHPKFIDALCTRVENALQKFKGAAADEIRVLFTAHSLPERILKMNDPYPQQLLETSEAIASRTGTVNWEFAWQSAGRTHEPWLGPDILEVLQAIHDKGSVKHVLICPVGFVSDHLEVLYDIDIECQALCKELGLHLERTASLNIDPQYMEALADTVRENTTW
jgi:ferrochelatase